MDDLETVRRMFDAYAARDLDSLLALLDPDVEVRSLLTEAERTSYRGHDGVREWFAAVFEIFPDWHPRITSLSELGDGAVLVGLDSTATSMTAGVPIEQAFWQAVRVEDGRVVDFGFHRSEADARAGLETPRA